MQNLRELSIKKPEHIAPLRQARDLDVVRIETRRLKYRRALRLAIRSALFALKPGGVLEVLDEPESRSFGRSYEINFSLVRSWVFALVGRDTTLELIEPDRGRIVLRRSRPAPAPGWSAGVIFSGAPSEVPLLHRCLEGLRTQPELHRRENGQIVVCGPESAKGLLDCEADIEYLAFESAPGPRFLISQKKNALVAALRNPRIAVLHSRIILEPGALANVPQEFDAGTPDVFVMRNDRRQRYLSLGVVDTLDIDKTPTRPSVTYADLPAPNPMLLHRRGTPYIDGGLFVAMKSVYATCSLNPEIAWGENEDGEWCSRLAAQGYLVELFPNSTALSQTDKYTKRPRLPGRLDPALAAAWRLARHHFRALRHYSSLALRQR
jgi:hypothetical protein